MMIGVPPPPVAPVPDFTASVSHGESLPRAFAGALGGAIGADSAAGPAWPCAEMARPPPPRGVG